jgi:glutamine synthetase type III
MRVRWPWSNVRTKSPPGTLSIVAVRRDEMASLGAYAREKGVKYFLIAFVDLFGTMRAKIVPATAIDAVAKAGAGFAGFATWLDLTPAHPDMLVMPEPDTAVQLPWKPEIAWVTGDLVMDGKPLAQNPRQVLKRVVEAAAREGYEMKTGVECEYFLIQPDGSAISDSADTQSKPCYDQQALMRRYEVIKEICDAMIALGWNPYQNDHEDANGQFEMNWEYDTCLRTADKHAFFKFMVKSIAEKHGLRATFMPKPFLNLTGNGCHAHVSLWSKGTGKNVFEDAAGEMGLSKEAYHFIGGIMHSADALAAITNPTVNSYKRINAPRTTSGATWSPNTVTYGGNNRTHMIRIPEAGRFELRLADGATNPYLLQAALLAAGLDGLAAKRDPGKRLDIDMYAEGHTVKDAKRLPLNMLDALRALEKSSVVKMSFGEGVVASYIKLRQAEWNEYAGQLTDWERQATLDC